MGFKQNLMGFKPNMMDIKQTLMGFEPFKGHRDIKLPMHS